MNKFENKIITVGTAGLSFLAISGCSSEPTVPIGTISAETVAQLPVTTITAGESSYVNSISPSSVDAVKIISGTEVVDHIYPAKDGIENDIHTPEITNQPARFSSQVTLSGSKSNYLDNDKGCDSYKIPESVKQIVALALGGNPNSTSISWPTLANGEPAHHFDLCYLQGSEPSDGVVLYYQ